MEKAIEAQEGAVVAPSLIERVTTAISWAAGAVAALLIVLILAITALSVFNRYILGKPLIGVDEATGFLVVAVVMFGAAEALRRGDHIRIDLLLEHAGPRLRRVLDLWAQAAVLAFSVMLLVTAWHTVVFSRQFGAYSSGYLEMPMWIPQSTMVLGAVLLVLVSTVNLIRHVAGTAR